jgi:hypothetical protein
MQLTDAFTTMSQLSASAGGVPARTSSVHESHAGSQGDE